MPQKEREKEFMKITWYGHSCFAVEHGGYTVLLDPYYPDAVPGLGLPMLTAQKVLCSHQHKDHGAAELIKLVPGPEDPFTITTMEVFHDHHEGEHRGKNTIHILEAGGIRVAHLGDLGHLLSEEQAKKLQWMDAVMIPVGGHFTIDPAEAKQVLDAIHPRVVIPMHYRGEGFGYPVIGPVEEFLHLCTNVQEYVSNTIDIEPATKAQTAVLALPSIVRR